MSVYLDKMKSMWSQEERVKININWDRIMATFSKLQQQINILAGGQEIDELLQSIQDAIDHANTSVRLAIDANDIATQQAISSNNSALQTALKTVSDTLIQLNTAITSANKATDDANTATTNANNARDAALKAVQDVTNAISTMQLNIQAYKDSFEHKSTYQNATQYRKNNEVLYNGSTYRAKVDTLGNPPPTALGASNTHWQLIARRGDDAPTSSLFGVWRGPTPPTNKQMLWWFDDSLAQGYETQIWVGPTAPDNTNVLWLNTGGA